MGDREECLSLSSICGSPGAASFFDGTAAQLEPCLSPCGSDCTPRDDTTDGCSSEGTPRVGTSRIQVYVRSRPLSQKELKEEPRPIAIMKDSEVVLLEPKTFKPKFTFHYTAAFDSSDPSSPNFKGQESLYNTIGNQVLDNVFEGYNACLLAYGQTGAGKTYTMMGTLGGADAGITPRLCAHLFAKIDVIKSLRPASFTVEAMYCEIYNEKVKDLLAPKGKPTGPLKIRQCPKQGTIVDGLSRHPVATMQAVIKLINRGNERRAVAATDLNDQSSRSHAVFTLNFTQVRIQAKDHDEVQTKEIRSVIHLVDLAGSERIKLSNVKGQQLEEAKSINLSLSTLGRVIECLASSGKSVDAPYRESTLTWMLKNSFGGNSKTIMIAAIRPCASSFEETLSTLRYASRAKKVVNRAVVNVTEGVKRMSELQVQIQDLQRQITEVPADVVDQTEQITALHDQLRFLNDMLTEVRDETETVRQRWETSEREKEEQAEHEAEERAKLLRQLRELTREHEEEVELKTEHVRRLEDELHKKDERIKVLSDTCASEQRQISELQQLVHTMIEKGRGDDARIQVLEAQLKVQIEKFHAAEMQAAAAEARAKVLENHQLDLENHNAQLLAGLRAKDKELHDLQKDLNNKSSRIAVLECQKGDAEQQQVRLASSIEDLKRELQTIPQAVESQVQWHHIGSLGAEFDKLRQSIEEQQKRSIALQQQLVAEREIASLKDAQRQLERQLEEERRLAQEEIKGLRVNIGATRCPGQDSGQSPLFRDVETDGLRATNAAMTEEVTALRRQAECLHRMVQQRDVEIRRLREQKASSDSQQLELTARLNAEIAKNQLLTEEATARMEHLETLEKLNAEMSNEYNHRLTKIITESAEWKKLVYGEPEADASPTKESEPKRTSLGGFVGAFRSLLTPRLRLAIPEHGKRSCTPCGSARARTPPSCRHYRSRTPMDGRCLTPSARSVLSNERHDTPRKSDTRHDSSEGSPTNSSNSSAESFCAVELIDEAAEQVAYLKLQNRVLESNLESMQRVLQGYRSEGTSPEPSQSLPFSFSRLDRLAIP